MKICKTTIDMLAGLSLVLLIVLGATAATAFVDLYMPDVDMVERQKAMYCHGYQLWIDSEHKEPHARDGHPNYLGIDCMETVSYE